jgi:hypothetical protein
MANSTILYACTTGGLAILNKPGTLPEWLPPRRVLEGETVAAAWADPGPPIMVLAAVGDTLMLSANGGRTSESVGAKQTHAAVTYLAYREDRHTIYAALQDGTLWRSTDSGALWEALPDLPGAGRTVSLLPEGEEAYLLLDQGGITALYSGNPDTGGWKPISTEGIEVRAIATAQDTGVLYALTPGGIAVRDAADGSWKSLQGSPQDGQALTLIPGANPATLEIVVGTPAGIAVGPDAGATWHTPELPQPGSVTALARDPERRDRLYAVTETGYLFESANRGQSWQPINAAPLAPVLSLYVVRI